MSHRLPAFLALSVVGAFATSAHAAEDAAAAAAAAAEQEQRSTIVVTGTKDVPRELDSPKAVTSIVDTPQTVTVISDQTLRKQNLLTLRDALQTIPGITFGAGEGGGGYGDSINLRGYSANNDITVDGVRDSAQYSRTDPFNLQQIEIYNGANSVYNGSGSVGGTINLSSKTPRPENLTILQGSVGTDKYYRGAVDSNWRLNENIAFRINGMYHHNDVPGRDVERFKRWGIAPSLTIGIDGPTSLTLAYVHQKDNNTPIYGVPFFKNQINNGPLAEVDDSDYFGIVNLDKQETTVDRLTATFAHRFSDELSVRNLTRWQRVHQDSQTSAPQGTFCLSSTGRQPITAGPNDTQGIACPATVPAGFALLAGPRALSRDQVNDLFYNQTDLRWETGDKDGFHNTLVVGGQASWEGYTITTASLNRDAAGNAVALPLISLSNPNTVYSGPINLTVTARSKSETENFAAYAFDNLAVAPWLELNAGLRYEHNKANFRAIPLTFVPPGSTALTPLQARPQINSENLFSYRVGVVGKPSKDISVYAAYANSRSPSSVTVRLGCGVPASAAAADPCAVAPEKARSYEIGVKASLFNNALLATAALFRNERSNFRTPSNDPALPASLQVLDGRSRVDGIALGLSGNVTKEWSIFANYTYLDSEVIQSVSNFCLANPAGTGCGNTAAIRDPQAGDELIQTPKHSGSLFTTYAFPFGAQIGYGFTYQGSFALNQRNLLGRTQFRSDDYLIHRLFVSYQLTQGLTAQVNVSNLTNKRYFTGIRNNLGAAGAVSGGWATPGDDRQAVFSLFYSF